MDRRAQIQAAQIQAAATRDYNRQRFDETMDYKKSEDARRAIGKAVKQVQDSGLMNVKDQIQTMENFAGKPIEQLTPKDFDELGFNLGSRLYAVGGFDPSGEKAKGFKNAFTALKNTTLRKDAGASRTAGEVQGKIEEVGGNLTASNERTLNYLKAIKRAVAQDINQIYGTLSPQAKMVAEEEGILSPMQVIPTNAPTSDIKQLQDFIKTQRSLQAPSALNK